MRYLVTADFTEEIIGALPLQQLAQLVEGAVIPSLDTLVKLEVDGKILAGGVAAGARSFAFVVDAASNDEVSRLLQGLPIWHLIKVNVTPLQTFKERAAQNREFTGRLKVPPH